MNLRERLMDYSLGNYLRLCWRLFRWRERARSRLAADIRIGGAKIGMGAAVSHDAPAGAVVVAQPPRVIESEPIANAHR